MKLKERFARFMMGRYGIDDLGKFLMGLYFVLLLVGLFVPYFYYLALALVIYAFWRSFSKKIYKRQQENARYLRLKKRFLGSFSLQQRKWKERKTHRYRKCPHCKATVRLPYKKGNHVVCCPKCRRDFNVKI